MTGADGDDGGSDSDEASDGDHGGGNSDEASDGDDGGGDSDEVAMMHRNLCVSGTCLYRAERSLTFVTPMGRKQHTMALMCIV